LDNERSLRIGIIGTGVAGLTTAWLLEPHHEVTVFEKGERLGGNAHTVQVRLGGRTLDVDAAAQYFNAAMYPMFLRLLRVLGLPCLPAPGRISMFDPLTERTVLPALPLDLSRWNAYARPAFASNMIQLSRVLRAGAALERSGDWSVTLGEFVEDLGLSRRFRDEVLYPFFTIFCGPFLDAIERTSARAALHYPLFQQPDRPWEPYEGLELLGGMGAYPEVLAAQLPRATVLRRCGAHAVRKQGDVLTVIDEGGATHEFDRVIVAAPAPSAAALLREHAGAQAMHGALSRFEYVETATYIHSDTSFMPRDRATWAGFNQRIERPACKLTMWIGQRHGDMLFKTLTDAASPPPEEVHHRFAYLHPLMTPAYYRAQRDLWSQQGQGGVFVVGAYTVGFEMHESGLASAVQVARSICPHSRNLQRLMAAEPVPLFAAEKDRRAS
jgi:uncharacterized protein